jgi:gas vesicle protein
MESPKMVAGAMIGGIVATSAGTIMNTVLAI